MSYDFVKGNTVQINYNLVEIMAPAFTTGEQFATGLNTFDKTNSDIGVFSFCDCSLSSLKRIILTRYQFIEDWFLINVLIEFLCY